MKRTAESGRACQSRIYQSSVSRTGAARDCLPSTKVLGYFHSSASRTEQDRTFWAKRVGLFLVEILVEKNVIDDAPLYQRESGVWLDEKQQLYFTASIWQEDEWFVAQCIEVDVASRGKVKKKRSGIFERRLNCTSLLP